VRAADSVWPAEGAEAARGAHVRVTGCKGTVLTVEPV
jgi:membrane protein implicated in regulation of membrane protease activity